MKRYAVPALLTVCLSLSACVHAPLVKPEQSALDTLLLSPALRGAVASIVVRDANTGAMVYQHNPETRLIPASSLKLLTSATAFDVLGPDYRFSTEVLTTGVQDQHTLNGNLYLRGSGDPTMQAGDYQALAAAVAAKGITRITGDLIVDDTFFDAVRLGSGWENDDEDQYFASQISALTVAPDARFNAGTILINVMPGVPVQVSMSPENDYVHLQSGIVNGASNDLTSIRMHGSNQVLINGTVASPTSLKLAIWEPTRLVAQIFGNALRQYGVEVQGRVIIGAATASDAQLLARHEAMPLAEMNKPLLKWSNNSIAEALLKAVGAKASGVGSAEAGVNAVTAFLSRLNLQHDDRSQVDGSGLSRRDLISAQEFSDLLIALRKQVWFDAWYAGLPVAGNSDLMQGGTLYRRMRGTVAENNVHAKSGTMLGVSSLTGYVTNASKRPLVFSIVLNNFTAPVKAIEDEMVTVIAASH